MAALKADDDLKDYMPEEDESNQFILESAMNSSTRDPMQAHCLDHEEVIFEFTKKHIPNRLFSDLLI